MTSPTERHEKAAESFEEGLRSAQPEGRGVWVLNAFRAALQAEHLATKEEMKKVLIKEGERIRSRYGKRKDLSISERNLTFGVIDSYQRKIEVVPGGHKHLTPPTKTREASERVKHRRYCAKSSMRCAVFHPDERCPDITDCEACKQEKTPPQETQ